MKEISVPRRKPTERQQEIFEKILWICHQMRYGDSTRFDFIEYWEIWKKLYEKANNFLIYKNNIIK